MRTEHTRGECAAVIVHDVCVLKLQPAPSQCHPNTGTACTSAQDSVCMEGIRAEGVRTQLVVKSALKLQCTRTLVLSISPLPALAHKH